MILFVNFHTWVTCCKKNSPKSELEHRTNKRKCYKQRPRNVVSQVRYKDRTFPWLGKSRDNSPYLNPSLLFPVRNPRIRINRGLVPTQGTKREKPKFFERFAIRPIPLESSYGNMPKNVRIASASLKKKARAIARTQSLYSSMRRNARRKSANCANRMPRECNDPLHSRPTHLNLPPNLPAPLPGEALEGPKTL